MNIMIPPPNVTSYVLPPVPEDTSPALRSAIDSYLAEMDGDGSDESAARWSAAVQAIAAHSPASLIDVAVKLLFVTQYLNPIMTDGAPAIDLTAFDVDGGRLLLGCVGDVLAFAEGGS